ncbi:MAG TPA: glycolate oxidase subunit GlcF, partial [Steroidobacteraceae bacterium]|nr:glycolate oxidase subunit GlcF [Steroidobacteraceae bacterium]
TRSTQQHLDRCLTCLNCQTTCPSGVEYGHLVDIGRRVVEARVARPAGEKVVRWALKEGLTSALFARALWLGRALRPMLPEVLRNKVPVRAPAREPVRALDPARPELPPERLPPRTRKVLMLQGCVQPSMMPNIDRATARVLDMAGIQTLHAAGTGCCGALRTHLNDSQGGLADMRRNIDAWMPLLAAGDVEAIISSASACALSIKEYGHALSGDAAYAEKAARISALARDLSELLPQLVPALKDRLRGGTEKRAVFHAPCTLQHGQRLRGGVEGHLRELGFEVMAAGDESHLCCGSAGAYSILQPQIAMQLRDRKLEHLAKREPECILSANIGCIQHLQSGTSMRVMHWVEFLDEALV